MKPRRTFEEGNRKASNRSKAERCRGQISRHPICPHKSWKSYRVVLYLYFSASVFVSLNKNHRGIRVNSQGKKTKKHSLSSPRYYRSTFCFFVKNLNHKVHKEHKDLINFIFNCYREPYLFALRTRLRENRQLANLKVNPMECKTIPLRVCPTIL